jgi:hypothetical protein
MRDTWSFKAQCPCHTDGKLGSSGLCGIAAEGSSFSHKLHSRYFSFPSAQGLQ